MKKETKNDHNNQRVLLVDKLEEYLRSIKLPNQPPELASLLASGKF